VAEHEASPRTPSAPLHWRVKACRWLLGALGFVWGTLIVGIVIATIANLNTTTTDTPLAKLYIVHLVQAYPLPLLSSLGLLIALTLLSWLGSRDKRVLSARPLSEQDRIYMLRRLRVRYEQILAQSLQGAVQMELGLAERPAAVQNAVSLALRLPDQPEHPLPPHTSIVQVYEQAQQELLILGEPGAGKSTLLLELARSLVAEAEQDVTRPLPILLPLSSWAVNRRSLDEWLGEEIARLYDVPRRLSRQWIQAEQVLPLLDGLDEMEEAARPACIATINTYHRQHLRPLVVCSRTSEYEAAAKHERLALHTAIVVQPLESKQVDAYLVNLGKPLAGLRTALKTNTLLQELATTPLMLQVLMLTYHGTSVRALSQREPQLRKQIWTDYVQRMVRGKGDAERYPLPVTTGWLSWLASEMRQHNQTIFSLESLQSDLLPKKQKALYQCCIWLTFGLIGWLIGLPFGLLNSLSLGIVVSLAFNLGSENKRIAPVEILTLSWKHLGLGLGGGLAFGLAGGLWSGLISLLIGRQAFRMFIGLLVTGLFLGLVTGLFFGVYFGLPVKQLTERLMLSPNEGIQRSIKNGLFILCIGLLGAGGSALVFGLGVWLIGMLKVGLGDMLIGALYFALLPGLGLGLGMGLAPAIRHYILRFWLAQSGAFPWRAVPFLEDATTRILLQRVGGGYSFVHRLLLDHFADLDAQTPLARGAAQTKSTSVQTKASTSANEN